MGKRSTEWGESLNITTLEDLRFLLERGIDPDILGFYPCTVVFGKSEAIIPGPVLLAGGRSLEDAIACIRTVCPKAKRNAD
jgi:hypothetical protein